MSRAKNKDTYDLRWFLAQQAQGYVDSLLPGGPRTGFEWIACDKAEELAVFWPCDFGSIPKIIHDFPLEQHLRWWEYLYALDDCVLIQGDDETDLPKLGFYYYSLAGLTGLGSEGYSRLGRPVQPKRLADLPAEFHAIVGAIRYPGLFRDTEVMVASRHWKTR